MDCFGIYSKKTTHRVYNTTSDASVPNPVISQGFGMVAITAVPVGPYETILALDGLRTVLGEKFWPDARPQVKKARRRI